MASYQKYKTKKGQRWLVQYYVKDPLTGKSKPKTKRGFLTKGEAIDFIDNLKDELKSGVNVLAKKTFEEVYLEWMREEEKKWEKSTVDIKKSKFESRILPKFKKLLIDEITEEYCQAFIESLEKEIKSARDYGIQLNLVFKFAKRKRYINNNPMEYVVYAKTRKENGENEDEPFDGFWTKDEVNRFLEIAEMNTEFKTYVLFRLALYSGLRKGELLALTEDDLLEDTKEVYVRKTLYWKKGNVYELLDPKTKKSIRKVKLDDETWELLQKLILANNKLILSFGMRNKIKDKFLFMRDGFRPLRLAYPNEVLTSMCRRFGFTEIKFHGLRHTHASMLFAAGASMKEVQERLGHSRIDTTMNIYTHLTDDVKEEVQNKFIEYMNQDNSKNAKNELTSSKHHQKSSFS